MDIYEQKFPSHTRIQKNKYFEGAIRDNILLANKELKEVEKEMNYSYMCSIAHPRPLPWTFLFLVNACASPSLTRDKTVLEGYAPPTIFKLNNPVDFLAIPILWFLNFINLTFEGF